MYRQIIRKIRRNFQPRRRSQSKYQDINPEDIFLDSTNLPGFETERLEGRMQEPLGKRTFLIMKAVLTLIVLALVSKLWVLGIARGPLYAEISENNRLEQTLIFSNRGVIFDRNMEELATNDIKDEESDFATRLYTPDKGLSHVVGFMNYPLSDSSGIYYEENYRGRAGIESASNDVLNGENGLKLKEIDVFGEVISESVIRPPSDGESIVLSIDAGINKTLYNAIKTLAQDKGFVGGSAVILDVETGEVLAMTSFPEFDQNVLTSGKNRSAINSLINDSSKPFLNRAIGGLYPPGSTLKPIIALAALNENIISPEKEILSTGSITVPNPYDPDSPSIFKDWKEHGWTDMREAIAVSSDTYFYTIGGGYEDQKGLGITLLDKYFQDFGLTEKTGIELPGEVSGVIPTPEWKKENFGGDIWRLGDTYITSIGQYGTQITPLNAARFASAIANGGKILKLSLILDGKESPVQRVIDSSEENWKIVREGMRAAVTYGTSVGLNVSYVHVAAKTGTAEIGSAKRYVHSWSIGFFPFENPKYSWAIVMERGPSSNTLGATSVVRNLLDWMSSNAPEYF